MKFIPQTPPRSYQVGVRGQINILDVGKLELEENEQVTFCLPGGAEYDVTRKKWGFYATPSLNGRLSSFGLKAVLIKNKNTRRFFVLLVQVGKERDFASYCNEENLKIVSWLDSSEVLESLEEK